MDIKVGQIYEVTTDNFFTTKKAGYHRITKIEKGEKIEIRYPYEWHFRTEDGGYFHCTPETIENEAALYGVIFEKVRFNNKCQLDEIIRLQLYDKKR